MAGNFNISVTKTGNHVYLKLNGNFDGSSACELVNLLSDEDLSTASKILVDTDFVKNVHPFGLNVLQNRLYEIKARKIPLIFTGKMSAQFAPR
jgi:anti-anti-sigma regulatory factor